MTVSADIIHATLLDQVTQRGPDQTICPSIDDSPERSIPQLTSNLFSLAGPARPLVIHNLPPLECR
ncbi:MAG: hypothetical protein WBA99_00255 [Nodosilinea sp.]